MWIPRVRDSHKHLKYIKVPLPKPYFKVQNPSLNELGLPDKPYYMTQDVCKVLKISPDGFRQRIYRGHYPEFQKIGAKRIFTLKQIKELISITERFLPGTLHKSTAPTNQE